MKLHTLNATPADSSLARDCVHCLGTDDVLLLIEDGVLAALDPDWVAGLPCPLYVLREDVSARGLQAHLDERATPVDYAGFVRLCCDSDDVINWC